MDVKKHLWNCHILGRSLKIDQFRYRSEDIVVFLQRIRLQLPCEACNHSECKIDSPLD